MSLAELRRHWERDLEHRGPCVGCGGARVWHDGTHRRKASLDDDGVVVFAADIPKRRLRCGSCGARWTNPSRRLSSRAHYQPCVVSRAIAMMAQRPDMTIAAIARAIGCHRRTIARWIERVAAIADPAALTASVVAEADAPVLPAVPTEIRRSGGTPRSRAGLLRALVILALLEALASLRGLEPPALAYAAVLVPRIPADAPCPRIRGDPRSRA